MKNLEPYSMQGEVEISFLGPFCKGNKTSTRICLLQACTSIVGGAGDQLLQVKSLIP